jgi:hypothetical protein
VKLHAFLTSTLSGKELLVSYSSHITPVERVMDSHWIGGWVDSGLSGEGNNLYGCQELELNPSHLELLR